MTAVRVHAHPDQTNEERYLKAVVASMTRAVLAGRESFSDDPRAMEVMRLARRALTPEEFSAALDGGN